MRSFVFALRLLLCGLVLSACGHSSLPEPSGKGTIRAINAIPTAPDIQFLIEQNSLGTVGYQSTTTVAKYDDFAYEFNFRASFPGETTSRLIASDELQVTADTDYIYLITGALDSPTLIRWEAPIKKFTATDTQFEVRFSHAAASQGPVDVYFAPEGVAPVLGDAIGSLQFGEILDPHDFEMGDYVLTITAAGDPATVLFESSAQTYASQTAQVVSVFDADANDTAPLAARIFSSAGGQISLADPSYPPTVRFVQADIDLGPMDVYPDDTLTTPLATGLQFGEVTADIPVAPGDHSFTYTEAGNPGAIILTSANTVLAGAHLGVISLKSSADPATIAGYSDRRPVETAAIVRLFEAAYNNQLVDLYLVPGGESIDDHVPRLSAISYSNGSSNVGLIAGSFDAYVTPYGEKTVLAGPLQLDVSLGDVVDLILLDTVDPATAALQVMPQS